eukprot:7044100-Alexandrium_andersonii.AAC.1
MVVRRPLPRPRSVGQQDLGAHVLVQALQSDCHRAPTAGAVHAVFDHLDAREERVGAPWGGLR